MAISNYEEKTFHSLGEIQVDIVVGTTIRPTLNMIISSKANYNLLWEENGSMGLTLFLHLSIKEFQYGEKIIKSRT